MPEKKLSTELQDAIKEIVKACEDEDREARSDLVRIWKRNEEFWEGFQYLFWNKSESRWMTPDEFMDEDSDELQEEIGSFYDYVIDIFKAHGESIIAALGAQVPGLRHVPDDADSQEDIDTARTYDKIGDLIQRHNKAKLIFLQALYYLYINGLVCSYIYKDSDPDYGEYKVPVYETQEKQVSSCPDCGWKEDVSSQEPVATDETDDEPERRMPDNEILDATCPSCGSSKTVTMKEQAPVLTGYRSLPKTRVKIDVYGPLFVKVSLFAQNQDQCAYLIHYMEHPIDSVQYAHRDDKEIVKKLEGEQSSNSDRFIKSVSGEEYERRNLITVKRVWLRPSKFFVLKNKDHLRDKLLKDYPDGIRVEMAGKSDVFLNSEPEKLDSRWKIGKAGLSTYIHAPAKCTPVVPLQELKNQLANLSIETIEHGIPTDFADPEVLNFPEYGRFEVIPGAVYKAKPRTPSARLADSFYTSNRATLSKEVPLFNKQIEQDAQFALGSFPSIFGGPAQGNSRTFSEYAASRQMALQRLSIDNSFVVDWWVQTIHEASKMYAETVVEDDRFVKRDRNNYVNVWIRKSEMIGKIGGVEPEASDTFPVSLAQKKDLIIKLLELQNPVILNALFTPQNATILQDTLALNEFKIPGEDQRVKQLIEISEMTRPDQETGETPVPVLGDINPETGQPEIVSSSVPIDPDVDDHNIHIITVKEFLISQIGMDIKRTNPAAYMNCLQHMKDHQKAMMVSMFGMGGPEVTNQPPENPVPQEVK